MSTQPEIESIIERHLIFGHAIQIGNLRMTGSELSPKFGEPSKNYGTIRFTIKNGDETDTTVLDVPHYMPIRPYSIPHHKTYVTFRNMTIMMRTLIWLGERLTGEKAELIEYTEDG